MDTNKKTSENNKQTPKWEELEKLIAKIQENLAPDAEIKHNHRVKGKSGRTRKLDVTISQKIGAYPVFIVFDCKHHSKPVTLKDVAAFAYQIEDVNARMGVMVSDSGFDAGAKAVAADKQIILQSWGQAEEADWSKLVGKDCWANFIFVKHNNTFIFAKAVGIDEPIEIPPTAVFYSKEGEPYATCEAWFMHKWSTLREKRFIGTFQLEGQGLTGTYIQKTPDSPLLEVSNLKVKTFLTAKIYPLNTRLHGKALRDFNSGEVVYTEVESQPFHIPSVIAEQEGIELTKEEYQKALQEMNMSDLWGPEPWIKFILTSEGKPRLEDEGRRGVGNNDKKSQG